jgi:hypothetical protein
MALVVMAGPGCSSEWKQQQKQQQGTKLEYVAPQVTTIIGHKQSIAKASQQKTKRL